MEREQAVEFGSIRQSKVESGEPPPFFLSGKKMYEIGTMDGAYPPMGWRRPGVIIGKRLGEVGPEDRPQLAAHLLSEMGGIWSQPIKAIESLQFKLEDGSQTWWLQESKRFVNHFAYADFYYEIDGITVDRRDFIAENDPALFVTLKIRNNRDRPVRLAVTLYVKVNIMPSWFSGWTNGLEELLFREDVMVAYDVYWAHSWGLAFGSPIAPVSHSISEEGIRKVGTLTYQIHVPADGASEIPFLFVADHERGYPRALEHYRELVGKREELFADKIAYYDENVFGGTSLDCSDRWFSEAFHIAKANLLQLAAEPTPYLGRYLFGGIPEYVQLFGTDTEYSVPGVVGVNFHEDALQALLSLAGYADFLCGRVPHEVTTNGHVFHPGNTQETPGFAIAAWSYFRWSGDRSFLEHVYPLCQEGVLDYVLAQWDLDLDFYPDGNSMVERLGMGSEKLDSACYFCKAIYCLSYMAEALGHPDESVRHRETADALRAAINVDFWIEDKSMWADSITEEHVKQLDGHWIVVVPMETGIADVEKGLRALDGIEKGWLNEWGMVHTRERENLVWTLPTGLLALAEFNYGRAEMGAWLVGRIAETAKYGTLGTFKELIPSGLSFLQLWSPAVFLQGVIEGIFHVDPRADLDRAEITPLIPKNWKYAKLDRLVIGEHVLDIHYERDRAGEGVFISHSSQGANFICSVGFLVEDGPLRVAAQNQTTFRERNGQLGEKRVQYVEVELEPFQRLELRRSKRQISLSRFSFQQPGNEQQTQNGAAL